jgi:hypothetical protein
MALEGKHNMKMQWQQPQWQINEIRKDNSWEFINFQGVEHRLEKYLKFRMFNISMIQKQQMLMLLFF